MKMEISRALFISSVLVTLYFQRASAAAGDLPPELEETSDDEIFTSRFNPEHGVIDDLYKWPNATAVYKFADNFNETEIARIKKSMAKVTADGCLKFREKQADDVDYVEYVKELHPVASKWFPCAVHVGRKGGRQLLYFGDPNVCIHDGYTAHMLLHIFGRIHEIHRPDRDEHFEFDMENTYEKRVFLKFDIAPTYGLPYDFKSIIQFSKYESAIDTSKPTIICKNKDIECNPGQLIDLTALDQQKMRVIYKDISSDCLPTPQ